MLLSPPIMTSVILAIGNIRLLFTRTFYLDVFKSLSVPKAVYVFRLVFIRFHFAFMFRIAQVWATGPRYIVIIPRIIDNPIVG